ncbi:MAG: hypothetical protein AAF591_23665, partial [Verrucomicrobiota bacterium]
GVVLAEAEALSGLMGCEIEYWSGGKRRGGRFVGLGGEGEMRVVKGDGVEELVVQADGVRVVTGSG